VPVLPEAVPGAAVLSLTAEAAQLEHEHAAVAVEGDLRGVFDERLGEHGLDPVSAWEQQAFGFLCRRHRTHRRFGREIHSRIGRIPGVRRGARPWTAVRRLNVFPRRALRLRKDDQRRKQRGSERGRLRHASG